MTHALRSNGILRIIPPKNNNIIENEIVSFSKEGEEIIYCEYRNNIFYELWADSESLAAHFQHPYYERMAGLLQGVGIVSSTNQAYLVERGEPVYTEDGERKTAFFQD